MPTQATKSIRENNFPTLKKKVGFVPSPQSWRENNYSRPPLKKVLWLSIKFWLNHILCAENHLQKEPYFSGDPLGWGTILKGFFSKLDVITRGTWPEIKNQHLSLTGWGALFSNGLSGIWLGKPPTILNYKARYQCFFKKVLENKSN